MEGNTYALRLPPEIQQDEAFVRKYRVERELGTGGMGVVYVAHHLELDEQVAIKFLLPEPAQNEEAVARFRREARVAIKIKNEHVVRMIDFSTTESGIPYIVMEYLDGIDLERMIEHAPDRRLPVATVVDFVLQACEALAEGHCRGIVHRDLKPANLFCVQGADGMPLIKVLDFGISKISRKGEASSTDELRFLGSPRYMSPEQIESSRDVDARADIWAIGVLLYESLTGQAPFVGTSLLQLSHRIRTTAPVPVTELCSDIPPEVAAVIDRCLAKDRAARYSSLAELAKALVAFAPERARPSVARIVRTIESPGRTTAALGLGALDEREGGSTTMRVWRKIRSRVAFVVLGGIALGVVLVRVAVSARSPAAPTVMPVVSATPQPWPSVAAPFMAPAPPSVEPSATASSSAPAKAATAARGRAHAAATAVAEPLAPPPPAPAATKGSPWIVDIVDKRKTAQ
jgi:serine/threonine-protein kinase